MGMETMKITKQRINSFTRKFYKFWQLILLFPFLSLGLPSFAQSNLLNNGDFSTLPTLQPGDQISLGNNLFSYAYTLPGWIFSIGEKPNLVKVNLTPPNSITYYPSGPNSDVTNPGGVGYYLDIAGGANAAYQTFNVPTCGQAGTASYRFSGYFSGRDGQTGNGSISILQGTGISGAELAKVSVVAVSNTGGATTGGWFFASSTVNLTAGQTYSYVVLMDNPVNFDEAVLVPLTTLGCADMSVAVDIPQATATLGSTVNGTVSFANTSGNPAVSPTFTLQLTPGLAGVNVVSPVLGTGVYNPGDGIVTFPNVPASVAPNTIVTAAISFTQPNGTVNVTATTGAVNDTITTNNTSADSVVFAPNIVPTTESGTAPAGVTTTAIANVAANDSVNGAPATLGAGGNATITPGVLPTGVTLNTTTGAITVTPSTPPGTYTFSYTLCDKNTPPNCAPMTDTLVVSPALVTDAVNDSYPGVPASGTTTAPVTANDTVNLNGTTVSAVITPGATQNASIPQATLTSPAPSAGSVSFNTTTGQITVAPSTSPGTYTFNYQLCLLAPNQTVCDTATATVVVSPAKGTISGTAWIDANGNGLLDANEPRVPGLRVGVFTTNASGVRAEVTNPATRPITDANGLYSIPNLPSSDAGGPTYEIIFFNEAGVAILGTPKSMSGTSNDGTVPNTLDRIIGIKVPGGGETTLQNLPLDPSGVVYDSATRLPVAGAVVTFNGPAGFNPAVHLVGGAANVSQTTGPSGIYQFLLLPGAPAGTYAISVTPPASYTLSSSIPPQVGAFPSAGPAGGTNAVVPNAQAPQIASNDPTTHYLSFVLIPGTSADVINNHIPLDFGVQPKLGISKAANKASGELGDTVLYTVKLRNIGQTVVPAGVSITDRLPAGFRYILGTSQATLPGTLVSTAIADPSGGVGAVLGYTTTQALQVGAEYLLQYRVRIGVGAQQGDGINRVQAKSGTSISNEAQAKVKVTDGVFTSDGCVAGKVFVDCNNNHIQDAEELGIPAVRMYMEDGTYFVTDSEGKYSYCGISAKSHVISIDMLSMPRGSRMTTTSNRNLGDGNSIFLDVKSGQIIRADFAEGSCSNTTLEQVKVRRTQGEVRSTDTEKTGQPALTFEGKSLSYPQRGTDSANQPLVVPRTNNGGTDSVPEQNKPVPQIPGPSSNTQGANVRDAK
jgi:large repetitive protein